MDKHTHTKKTSCKNLVLWENYYPLILGQPFNTWYPLKVPFSAAGLFK